MKRPKISYTSQLDFEYGAELRKVENRLQFDAFLRKYWYWLDKDTQKLTGEDWTRLKPLIDDCRKPETQAGPKYDEAAALLLPLRILRVSHIAAHFHIPFGTALARMRDEGNIDY